MGESRKRVRRIVRAREAFRTALTAWPLAFTCSLLDFNLDSIETASDVLSDFAHVRQYTSGELELLLHAPSLANLFSFPQPSVLSIFSSASSHPTLLASRLRASTAFPSDSFISLVRDATDEEEQVLVWHGTEGSARDMKGKGKEVERGNLRSRVLHLQAPDIKSTSIRLGAPTRGAEGLGVSLPFLHLAVKDLGHLFFFDVCVRDERGQLAMIRASTWQVSAPNSSLFRSPTDPFPCTDYTQSLPENRQSPSHAPPATTLPSTISSPAHALDDRDPPSSPAPLLFSQPRRTPSRRLLLSSVD